MNELRARREDDLSINKVKDEFLFSSLAKNFHCLQAHTKKRETGTG